ncbi:hypothetical protein SAMN04488131_11573 [Flavobacterium xueshanense]|uniref:Uncharacterized protein n=1 Tax=Flavobacterium xueshanense TaxID=935223 RepID=A0A1I2HRX7_9FLAO|nr:hypothetical protein SAMN04488131_11573 [Flavobacterium xueshanense]
MQHLEVPMWLNFFRKEKRKLILFLFCCVVNLAILAPRPKIANHEPLYRKLESNTVGKQSTAKIKLLRKPRKPRKGSNPKYLHTEIPLNNY